MHIVVLMHLLLACSVSYRIVSVVLLLVILFYHITLTVQLLCGPGASVVRGGSTKESAGIALVF